MLLCKTILLHSLFFASFFSQFYLAQYTKRAREIWVFYFILFSYFFITKSLERWIGTISSDNSNLCTHSFKKYWNG
ncbi:hypothetical protein BDZ91DRAFT_715038 [Kalaharituber pfeilii]|nr:hypothetical protein BDZ91DRAFT_715038 [Kalaharituber pfeilii]